MQKISLLVILFTISIVAHAAFNKSEHEQLAQINEEYRLKSNELTTRIQSLHQKSLAFFPEKSKPIDELLESWLSMLEMKCQLESFESLGTDSEVAVHEECAIAEKEKIADYFESMISMP